MVRTLLTLLLAVPLQSQTFEVASIRPSQPLTDVEAVGIHVDGAQVRYTSMNLRYYIRTAFRLRDYQLEAPEWLTNAIFDIRATLPTGSTPANAPEMLRPSSLTDSIYARTTRPANFPSTRSSSPRAGTNSKSYLLTQPTTPPRISFKAPST